MAAHARAVAGSGTWCAIDEARGEKSMRSPPRSRRIRSWLPSTLSRIASSLIIAGAGAGTAGSASAASCASRNSCWAAGAVV